MWASCRFLLEAAVLSAVAAAILAVQTELEELRAKAEQRDAHAQLCLGMVYATGQGVRQDHAEAAKWCRLGAEQGHDNAQFNLGGMYAVGRGVPQDRAEATEWYRLAAEQGQPSEFDPFSPTKGYSRSVLNES